MQKKRDTSPVEQMEFEFDVLIATSEFSSSSTSNVVHVQFGIPKAAPQSDSLEDRSLIDHILQSAQRLKW